MKYCTQCKTEKAKDGFPLNKSRKDGYGSPCKSCSKINRDVNNEMVNQSQRRRYLERSDEYKEKRELYKKQWVQKNHERCSMG